MTRLRRPIAGAALALLTLAVALALVVRGGGERPPASEAARLVPADVLAYLHVSTDRDREAVRRAGELVDRFPAVARGRDQLVSQLTNNGPGLSYRRDVRPWLGAEAAVALLDTPGPTATALAVIGVGDRARAEDFLARASSAPAVSAYRGVRIATYGALSTAFVGRFLVAGPVGGVRAAIDAGAGRVASLQRGSAFRRATRGLPADRAADAFLSPAGVARVLAAQPGLLGGAGSLLRQPGLAGTALALSADDGRARLHVHTLLDRRAGAGGGAPRQFEPQLAQAVPADALAYLGTAGLERSAGRLLLAVGGRSAPAVAAVLNRAGAEARRSGVDLRRRIAPMFRGEVAMWLKAASPAPVLTVIVATGDEPATRRALADLHGPLARALQPAGGGARVTRTTVEGRPAFTLRLGPAAQLVYSVFDGRLVISTAPEGIADVARASEPLPEAPAFEATLGERPDRVTSLVFLDFEQLLRLGERSGVSANPAYGPIRGDLRRIRALGAATSARPGASTTEVVLEIR